MFPEEITGLSPIGQANTVRIAIPKKSLVAGSGSQALFKAIKIPVGKTAFAKLTLFGEAGAARAVYEVRAAIANKAGTVALVGAAVQTFVGEDTVAWDGSLVADNTAKTLNVQATPDASTATIFWGILEVQFN